MSNKETVTYSFPFLSVLCLIFITLKLTGHITWSWVWVLCPLWIPVSIILFVMFAVLSIFAIGYTIDIFK